MENAEKRQHKGANGMEKFRCGKQEVSEISGENCFAPFPSIERATKAKIDFRKISSKKAAKGEKLEKNEI